MGGWKAREGCRKNFNQRQSGAIYGTAAEIFRVFWKTRLPRLYLHIFYFLDFYLALCPVSLSFRLDLVSTNYSNMAVVGVDFGSLASKVSSPGV